MSYRPNTSHDRKRPFAGWSPARRLHLERLENRQMLATITINTLIDEADGSITDGDISLRDAIARASGTDVIDFAPSLTSGGPAVLRLTRGEVLIERTRTIQGPGADKLTIDASGNDLTPLLDNGDGSRAFMILRNYNLFAPIRVSISGLTIAGGDVTGNGGGIFNNDHLTLSGVKLLGNYATGSGGGLFHEASSPANSLTIVDSTISGNAAGSVGGGIYSRGGDATITRSTITSNSASDGFGGGIFNSATMSITASVISNNSATLDVPSNAAIGIGMGGGINNNGSLTLKTSYVSGNTATLNSTGTIGLGFGGGGGIYNNGGFYGTPPTASIVDSTFNNNTVQVSAAGFTPSEHFGGGAISNAGNLSVINSTFSYNRSLTGDGGAILERGSTTIITSTIADNFSVRNGGGLAGTFEVLTNTIVANNTAASGPQLQGTFGGSHNFMGELTLGPLQDNGGPTFTRALPIGSPAINAGNPVALAGVDGIPPNDQRGAPYTRVSGGRIDIGAFESQPPPGPALPGDYNNDGRVNAADFVLWRNTKGMTVTPFAGADGNGNGTVDQADYEVWRMHFGQKLPGIGSVLVDVAASVPPTVLAEPVAPVEASVPAAQPWIVVPISPDVHERAAIGLLDDIQPITAVDHDAALLAWWASRAEPSGTVVVEYVRTAHTHAHETSDTADDVDLNALDVALELLDTS